MTYGRQTSQQDAFAQMNLAVESGITLFDCAEIYPVNPIRAETIGDSERIIGRWLTQTQKRDQVQIATKVSGINQDNVRAGAAISGATIREAVEQSLIRLETDVIDLYQLHWPNRDSYCFRNNWTFDPNGPSRSEIMDHMHDVINTLKGLVAQGKIRSYGLSNETAWGTTKWMDVTRELAAPPIAAVQNEYSLLARLADTDLAEALVKEKVTLLAYSPLATGLLTGKYQEGAIPEGSRMAVSRDAGEAGNLGGRKTERAFDSVAAYLDLAKQHGWALPHLALNWLRTRPFQVIPILGATRLDQLSYQISGLGRDLDVDLQTAIDDLHKQHPLPY